MDDCYSGQSPGNDISIPAAPHIHESCGQNPSLSSEGRAGRRPVGGGGGGASDRSWLMEGASPSVLVPAQCRATFYLDLLTRCY